VALSPRSPAAARYFLTVSRANPVDAEVDLEKHDEDRWPMSQKQKYGPARNSFSCDFCRRVARCVAEFLGEWVVDTRLLDVLAARAAHKVILERAANVGGRTDGFLAHDVAAVESAVVAERTLRALGG
jgi:hypothetical protein